MKLNYAWSELCWIYVSGISIGFGLGLPDKYGFISFSLGLVCVFMATRMRKRIIEISKGAMS